MDERDSERTATRSIKCDANEYLIYHRVNNALTREKRKYARRKRQQILKSCDDKFRDFMNILHSCEAIVLMYFRYDDKNTITVYNTPVWVTTLQASIVSRRATKKKRKKKGKKKERRKKKIDTIGKDLHRKYAQVFRSAITTAA